jgi:hypothetical protein
MIVVKGLIKYYAVGVAPGRKQSFTNNRGNNNQLKRIYTLLLFLCMPRTCKGLSSFVGDASHNSLRNTNGVKLFWQAGHKFLCLPMFVSYYMPECMYSFFVFEIFVNL